MKRLKGPSPEKIANDLSQADDPRVADLGVSILIVHKILATFSTIPGVILRSRVGERHLTFDVAAGSWLLVAFCTGGAAVADVVGSRLPVFAQQAEEQAASPMSTTVTGVLFLGVFSVALACRYFGGIWVRRFREDYSVHSRGDGFPWHIWCVLASVLPRPLQRHTVRCVMEPAAIAAGGTAISLLAGSGYLMLLTVLCTMGFWTQQVLFLREERNMLLDIMDGMLEARGPSEETPPERIAAPPRAQQAEAGIEALALIAQQRSLDAMTDAGAAMPPDPDDSGDSAAPALPPGAKAPPDEPPQTT